MRGGDPKKIGTLLDKYKKTLRAPQGSVIKVFQEILKRECGVSLKKEQVRYTPSSRTLSILIAGPMKQELLMQKENLLTHLRAELGEKSAPHHII